jgi:hypothetical protein
MWAVRRSDGQAQRLTVGLGASGAGARACSDGRLIASPAGSLNNFETIQVHSNKEINWKLFNFLLWFTYDLVNHLIKTRLEAYCRESGIW